MKVVGKDPERSRSCYTLCTLSRLGSCMGAVRTVVPDPGTRRDGEGRVWGFIPRVFIHFAVLFTCLILTVSDIVRSRCGSVESRSPNPVSACRGFLISQHNGAGEAITNLSRMERLYELCRVPPRLCAIF